MNTPQPSSAERRIKYIGGFRDREGKVGELCWQPGRNSQ